jgi:hypothetical protein
MAPGHEDDLFKKMPLKGRLGKLKNEWSSMGSSDDT